MHKEILEEIKKYKNIIIHRHMIPDGDAFGSQIGLQKLIKLNYPEKNVMIAGENSHRLANLGKMDEINDSNYEESLVIITDCGNVERIDDQRYSSGQKIIKIDHHPNVTPYGEIQWVDTSFTSASEMIGYFALKNNLKINSDIAKTIFYGIVTDSLRFVISTVSSRTFEVCSFLTSTGFDMVLMYKEMYKRKLNMVRAQSELIQNMKFKDGVGAIFVTKEILDKYDIPVEDNGAFSNLLKDIEEIDIWVSFAFNSLDSFRVEFRSKEKPINEIAIKWGGGGHLLASGAIIKEQKEMELIFQDLIKLNKGE